MNGSCLYCNSWQNPFGTNKKKSIRGTQRLPLANSNSFILLAFPLANFCILTHALTPAPTSTPALALALMPASTPAPAKYTNADFHQFMKIFIDAQEGSGIYEGL